MKERTLDVDQSFGIFIVESPGDQLPSFTVRDCRRHRIHVQSCSPSETTGTFAKELVSRMNLVLSVKDILWVVLTKFKKVAHIILVSHICDKLTDILAEELDKRLNKITLV